MFVSVQIGTRSLTICEIEIEALNPPPKGYPTKPRNNIFSFSSSARFNFVSNLLSKVAFNFIASILFLFFVCVYCTRARRFIKRACFLKLISSKEIRNLTRMGCNLWSIQMMSLDWPAPCGLKKSKTQPSMWSRVINRLCYFFMKIDQVVPLIEIVQRTLKIIF